jgi:hypothetical protein
MANYLDIDDVGALGVWDAKAVAAYRQALIDANRMGMNVAALLYDSALSANPDLGRGRSGSGGEGGGGGGGWMIDENGQLVPAPPDEAEQFVAPAFEVQIPNIADVRRVVRASVVDKLGEGWSQEQVDEVANTIIWKTMAVQADAYRQEVEREKQLFETGTTDIKQITRVQAPSPETIAEEEAMRRDPGGYEATQIAEDYAPEFFSALQGYV